MNTQELADIINGRQYRNEVDPTTIALAKASGLVIVYGASDDLIEIDGYLTDELGAPNGRTIEINMRGGIRKAWEEIDCTDEEEARGYFVDKALPFKTIECKWAPDDEPEASWVITTDMPHAKFNIMEDGEVFCRGIVFAFKDLAP